MFSKVFKIFKRIVFSFFMLYGYNLLTPSVALIPINLFTVLTLTVFEIPGLLFLIVIRLFVF